MTTAFPVLAVTGMMAEARIARGSGVLTIAGGGDPARLALMLQGGLTGGAKAVISFGIAGGLAPDLPPGTVIVADAVEDGETRWPVDPEWRQCLVDALPGSVRGDLWGVDRAVANAAAKSELHRRSGALAVDMESHVAARLAAHYRVPFAALRIIADPAERSLPQAALVGMRPNGTTDVMAVLRALAGRPSDLPALIRTAFDARAAFGALTHSRNLLRNHLGFGALTQPRPEFAMPDDPGLALAAEPRTLVLADGSGDTV